jgi:monovalent cation:H+ antiporter-2, CPA2 family
MEAGHQDLLKALAIVLGAAAVTGIISRRLRQPVVLGYLVAGLVVGPHLPIPLVADPAIVQTLSELGVILLMFALGLEFSLRKLFRVGPSVAVTAIVECSLMFWLGFATARLFGWTPRESIFTGAIVSISSTTIIAKSFEELGIKGKLHELVVGVLIIEDLIAIFFMATLTAISTGAGLSATSLVTVALRLGALLVALVVVGLLLVPRAMRRIIATSRPEGIVVASVALCFGTALLVRMLGYSVALGAFIAGSLIAESGEEKTVERLVKPVRDVFAAVFFVSVGMMMDPTLMARHWLPIVVLTVVVVAGKVTGVSLGAFLTGNGAPTSIRAGMSFAPIGEFSFILAGLGLSLRATGEFLFPVAVAVSTLTTLMTPWLIRGAPLVAERVDRHLPPALSTFAALYGSWLERLRTGGAKSEAAIAVRRLVRMLVIDVAVVATLVVGTAINAVAIRAYLVEKQILSADLVGIGLAAAVAALAAPFCIGIVRVGRKLGTTLATIALPQATTDDVDLAAAPRRALVVTLQLVVILLAGAPLVAITQPFLPGFQGAELLLGILVVLGVAAWRTASNLHGHVRAGAQVVVEALARQSHGSQPTIDMPLPLDAIMTGLGQPVAIELAPGSPAIGKTLADINLRGLTGAIVLAITRGGAAIIIPSSAERLLAGDVLAVAGTGSAVASARELLTSRGVVEALGS